MSGSLRLLDRRFASTRIIRLQVALMQRLPPYTAIAGQRLGCQAVAGIRSFASLLAR